MTHYPLSHASVFMLHQCGYLNAFLCVLDCFVCVLKVTASLQNVVVFALGECVCAFCKDLAVHIMCILVCVHGCCACRQTLLTNALGLVGWWVG